MSWNLEGTRLLTAGTQVQLWHLNQQPIEEDETNNVTFTLGGENISDSLEYVDEPDKPQGRSTLISCNFLNIFLV